ncbi:hypothetical protein SODALDRAFT_108612 [Sodiomyces alkalinus F11]|uniref:Uncharacterized protein n=1 Tax=Sodiomyces alkalinus (strain CBS 110278 / VKM F-3762 / F11) TaxID=1314773 RepID=A0A3N2Q2I1_SODAK|nr:hypothetical protein SODALDRAFT_108612 [Sodiomyces alkalinus F11]ROT40960.1 hypothetical protein SODALDRAFT_108612 [Sodiomyces alkalinus F11]
MVSQGRKEGMVSVRRGLAGSVCVASEASASNPHSLAARRRVCSCRPTPHIPHDADTALSDSRDGRRGSRRDINGNWTSEAVLGRDCPAVKSPGKC